jgi:hypothetical protein
MVLKAPEEAEPLKLEDQLPAGKVSVPAEEQEVTVPETVQVKVELLP